MSVYIIGPETSKLYNNTTPVKLAECAKFKFARSLANITPTENDILIRYGTSGFSNKDYLFKDVINYAEAIKRSSNKWLSTLLFRQKGIPIPKVITSASSITQEDLPVLRRNIHHTRGSDIKLINSLRNIPHGDYYSKFIDSKCEYRVHVFDDKVVRVQLKVKGEEPPREEMDGFIHNYENGFLLKDTYTHDLELEKSLFEPSIKAVKLLGLDFGAVDVLVGKDNKPYILEVNSAPRLNKYGRQLYTILLYRKLDMKFDLKDFSRVRENTGDRSNGLPIEFREIIVRN